MSVYKNKENGIYRIQFQMNGRTFVKTTRTTVKAVALQMEAKWRTEIHEKMFLGKREPITVDEIFDQYLTQPLAKTTLKNAKVVVKMLRKFTNTKLKATDFPMLEFERFVEWRRRNGTKENTIRSNLLIISGAWNRINKKVYEVPELELPTVARGTARTEFLTQEEETQLFDYLSNRKPFASGVERPYEMHDVFALLCDTGCRANEIATLTWEQVDLASNKLEVWRSKTSSSSYLTMTNRVHQVLQRRSNNKLHPKYVFPNWKRDNHRSLNTTYLNDVLKKAGVNKTVHCIRHGCAMKLLKAGMTLNDVRVILGHSSIVTTQRYQHIEATDVSPRAADIMNNQQVERNRSKLKVV